MIESHLRYLEYLKRYVSENQYNRVCLINIAMKLDFINIVFENLNNPLINTYFSNAQSHGVKAFVKHLYFKGQEETLAYKTTYKPSNENVTEYYLRTVQEHVDRLYQCKTLAPIKLTNEVYIDALLSGMIRFANHLYKGFQDQEALPASTFHQLNLALTIVENKYEHTFVKCMTLVVNYTAQYKYGALHHLNKLLMKGHHVSLKELRELFVDFRESICHVARTDYQKKHLKDCDEERYGLFQLYHFLFFYYQNTGAGDEEEASLTRLTQLFEQAVDDLHIKHLYMGDLMLLRDFIFCGFTLFKMFSPQDSDEGKQRMALALDAIFEKLPQLANEKIKQSISAYLPVRESTFKAKNVDELAEFIEGTAHKDQTVPTKKKKSSGKRRKKRGGRKKQPSKRPQVQKPLTNTETSIKRSNVQSYEKQSMTSLSLPHLSRPIFSKVKMIDGCTGLTLST